MEFLYVLRFYFYATNNEDEALLVAKKLEIGSIFVLFDSLIIMNQVKDLYSTNEKMIQLYLAKVLELIMAFQYFNITCVARKDNTRGDMLSKLSYNSSSQLSRQVIV